jgi:Na+-driven multidrug efflux pump
MTSFIALLIGSSKGENIRLSVMNVRLNIHNILEICNGGLPSLIRQGMAAIATVLLNRVALAYGGDAAIAGMSIVTRILMMLSSVLIGFGQGYQPVCSYNYGAGRYDRVKEGFWFCLKYGTIMMTIAAIICIIPSSSIVAWFRNDPEVVAVGSRALRWQASVLPLLALSTLTNMMLQATGKGLQASITSSARNGLFFIPLILILPRILGLTGVVMTQAIADICTVCLCIPIVAKELRKME